MLKRSVTPGTLSRSTPAPLHWHFPLPRPYTGILLGNGRMGLMVWGSEDVRISIGRTGFWDRALEEVRIRSLHGGPLEIVFPCELSLDGRAARQFSLGTLPGEMLVFRCPAAPHHP